MTDLTFMVDIITQHSTL